MFPHLNDLFSRTRVAARKSLVPGLIHLFLSILIIGAHLLVLQSGALVRVEILFLDAFLKHRPAQAIHPGIVFVEIDAEALEVVGAWPWPWRYHADLVRILKRWGARGIVLDANFRDPEPPEEAAYFSESLREGAVYLPVLLESRAGKKFWIHSMAVMLEPDDEKQTWLHTLPELEQQALGLGHRNLIQDDDGVVRTIAPYLSYSGETYPALALQAAYSYLGEALPGPRNLPIPLDEQGRFFVNWPRFWKDSFRRYSAAEVVRSAQAGDSTLPSGFSPEVLRDKLCFIGLSAPGAAELRNSPVENSVPAFVFQAAAANSILTGHHLTPASRSMNAFALAMAGFAAALFFVFFRHVAAFLAGLFLGLAWVCFSFFLLAGQGLWIYAFQPLLLILVLFGFSALYSQILSRREESRLFQLASRDGLTGLFVIRHFREILNQAVVEARTRREPLAVILIDLDNFKLVNDTYGHAAGDMVLRKSAGVVAAACRRKRKLHLNDSVARYGGEEFIVLLRKITLKQAAFNVAERIRRSLAETEFTWEGQPVRVTASLGVSSLRPGETIPDLMVRRADEALYRAKHAGKNQVCLETFAAVDPSRGSS